MHNVIIGKLWIEQYGTVEILNHRYRTLGGPHTVLEAGYDLGTRFHSALRCPSLSISLSRRSPGPALVGIGSGEREAPFTLCVESFLSNHKLTYFEIFKNIFY